MLSRHVRQAAEQGQADVIQYQLRNLSEVERMKAINEPDDTGNIALHYAVDSGDLTTVNLLLSYGADINHQGFFGETPLHHAAFHNHSAITKTLLEAKARNDIERNDNEKPIHVAAMSGASSVVKVLVENDNKQLKISSKEGRTPFYRGAMEGQTEVLKELIGQGDDVNQVNLYDNKKTALHLAAISNNSELAQFLVENGASPNKRDGGQLTPLQRCAMQYNPSLETAKIIISGGGDVNLGDKPPLYLLATHADQSSSRVVEFAKVLLENGCDLEAMVDGETAIDVLESKKNELEENEMGLYNLLKEHQKTFQKQPSRRIEQ